MIITPKDISTYISCPLMYYKNAQEKIYPPLTFYEENLRQAFIKGEEKALLKDTVVSVKRLVRAWDNVWWPNVMKYKIDMKEGKKKSLKATERFMDYCTYEITDYLYPTVGANIESQVNINGSILKASVDVMKVNLEDNKRNTVLVNFTNKELSVRDAAYDNMIKSIVYAFYSGGGEQITHLNVNINENNRKIKINISNFQPKEIKQIERTIYHVHNGIRNNIKYMNPLLCKECKLCPQFK